LPFAVQASRSFQPDPLMTSAFIIGVYFLYRWMESRAAGSSSDSRQDNLPSSAGIRHWKEEPGWKWAILAALFLGFAALVKIVIAFLIIGAAVAAVLVVWGRNFWRSAQVWAMAALMALPAIAYYVLGHPGRSTEYFFSWTVDLIKLIASPHFYADWLGFVGSLFGLTVLLLAAVGTVLAPSRVRWLLLGCWIGYLIYGLMLPFQMFTHSYYHIQLVPLVALGLAPAAETLIGKAAGSPRLVKAGLAVLIVAAIGYEAWAARSSLVAENFSDAAGYWSTVGRAMPANSNVIGLTQDYGYDLMYWGWRKVDLWPFDTDLSNVRNAAKDPAAQFAELTAGEDYFLVTAFGQLEHQPALKRILAAYPVAAQGDGYVLYDLRK
jgi:4-amino-4-deoxy-L-arabinose transferase-like glycosyltransferase